MIIKNIIQRVLSLYARGVQSDDSRLSKRHVYSVILSNRNLLITQKINKRQEINQWNYQTLDCIELIKAKPYECPCLPSIGCQILRTKEKIPKPLIGIIGGHLIQTVTTLEGSVEFSPTTWKDKKYKKGNKYTSTKPDYYFRDGYLYVTVNKNIKAITLTGLFEDPLAAGAFKGLCKEEKTQENCIECVSYLDRELPLDKDMLKTIIELSVQELLVIFNQSLEDLSNNSVDSPKERSI